MWSSHREDDNDDGGDHEVGLLVLGSRGSEARVGEGADADRRGVDAEGVKPPRLEGEPRGESDHEDDLSDEERPDEEAGEEVEEDRPREAEQHGDEHTAHRDGDDALGDEEALDRADGALGVARQRLRRARTGRGERGRCQCQDVGWARLDYDSALGQLSCVMSYGSRGARRMATRNDVCV